MKYTVTVHAEIEVEAGDESEAEAIARDMIDDDIDQHVQFTVDEAGTDIDDEDEAD